MKIINLSKKYEDLYCRCLEDWSEEMKEGEEYKKLWLERKKKQGLRVKLAQNDKDEIVGMIHYVPIENAPIIGENLYYIYCIWVYGYKKGVGDHQNIGIGKLLLKAAEDDSRYLGAKGICAWGITLPFFMRSKWFKKQGYKRADKNGFAELVWKPFTPDARPPKFVKIKKKPGVKKGFVSVTCFRNGWCPAQNANCERIKRATGEYKKNIVYNEIDTDDENNLLEWGIPDGIFIDEKQLKPGPPVSFEKLQKKLKKKMKKI